jgi:protease II
VYVWTLITQYLTMPHHVPEPAQPAKALGGQCYDVVVHLNLQDAAKRASTLWRHSVTARGLSKPVMVYNETDAAFSIGLQPTRRGRHIFLYSGSSTTASVMMLSADNPTGQGS